MPSCAPVTGSDSLSASFHGWIIITEQSYGVFLAPAIGSSRSYHKESSGGLLPERTDAWSRGPESDEHSSELLLQTSTGKLCLARAKWWTAHIKQKCDCD